MPVLCMFRKGRPLLPWLHVGLHFGAMLGAELATMLSFLVALVAPKGHQHVDQKMLRFRGSTPLFGPGSLGVQGSWGHAL